MNWAMPPMHRESNEISLTVPLIFYYLILLIILFTKPFYTAILFYFNNTKSVDNS